MHNLWVVYLIVKVPRPGDSEFTFSVSSQAATYFYQSNHSKVEAIPLRALSKNTSQRIASLFSKLSRFVGNVDKMQEG